MRRGNVDDIEVRVVDKILVASVCLGDLPFSGKGVRRCLRPRPDSRNLLPRLGLDGGNALLCDPARTKDSPTQGRRVLGGLGV